MKGLRREHGWHMVLLPCEEDVSVFCAQKKMDHNRLMFGFCGFPIHSVIVRFFFYFLFFPYPSINQFSPFLYPIDRTREKIRLTSMWNVATGENPPCFATASIVHVSCDRTIEFLVRKTYAHKHIPHMAWSTGRWRWGSGFSSKCIDDDLRSTPAMIIIIKINPVSSIHVSGGNYRVIRIKCVQIHEKYYFVLNN